MSLLLGKFLKITARIEKYQLGLQAYLYVGLRCLFVAHCIVDDGVLHGEVVESSSLSLASSSLL